MKVNDVVEIYINNVGVIGIIKEIRNGRYLVALGGNRFDYFKESELIKIID